MHNEVRIKFNYFGPLVLESSADFLSGNDVVHKYSQKLLADFLGIPPSDLTQELVERYIEVTPKDAHSVITPSYDKINAQIIEPLRVSKKAYCFKEHITSIALCGVVGEMMAHALYQMNRTNINGITVNSDLEKSIFGRSFDELGQMRRIEILNKLEYISSEQKKMLKYIQETRRPYMHWWNLGKSDDEIKSDAQKAVLDAIKLFLSVFNIQLASSSSVAVNDKVLSFLKSIPERKFYNDKL